MGGQGQGRARQGKTRLGLCTLLRGLRGLRGLRSLRGLRGLRGVRGLWPDQGSSDDQTTRISDLVSPRPRPV